MEKANKGKKVKHRLPKKVKEQKRQFILSKHRQKERERHKRYLNAKVRGELETRRLLKAGAKHVKVRISSAMGPGIPTLNWLMRFKNWLKSIIHRILKIFKKS